MLSVSVNGINICSSSSSLNVLIVSISIIWGSLLRALDCFNAAYCVWEIRGITWDQTRVRSGKYQYELLGFYKARAKKSQLERAIWIGRLVSAIPRVRRAQDCTDYRWSGHFRWLRNQKCLHRNDAWCEPHWGQMSALKLNQIYDGIWTQKNQKLAPNLLKATLIKYVKRLINSIRSAEEDSQKCSDSLSRHDNDKGTFARPMRLYLFKRSVLHVFTNAHIWAARVPDSSASLCPRSLIWVMITWPSLWWRTEHLTPTRLLYQV